MRGHNCLPRGSKATGLSSGLLFSGRAGDEAHRSGQPSPLPWLPRETVHSVHPCSHQSRTSQQPPTSQNAARRPRMMLQTNCTLGTSLSRESPSGKVSCGQGQLCRQAPSSHRPGQFLYTERPRLREGQTYTKSFLSPGHALGKDT